MDCLLPSLYWCTIEHQAAEKQANTQGRGGKADMSYLSNLEADDKGCGWMCREDQKPRGSLVASINTG